MGVNDVKYSTMFVRKSEFIGLGVFGIDKSKTNWPAPSKPF